MKSIRRSLLWWLVAALAAGMTVVIGTEHSSPELRPFSLIVSTYTDGRGTGTVGVIGPTRMAYDRVVPIVDVTAKLLSSALSQP